MYCLRSDTGTGKTLGVGKALEALPGRISTAVVTPRVSITEEAAWRFKITSYKEHGGALRVGSTPGAKLSVAVCINSVTRCEYTGHGALWLILEESDQIVAALFDGTIPLAEAAEIVEKLKAMAGAALSSGGGRHCGGCVRRGPNARAAAHDPTA